MKLSIITINYNHLDGLRKTAKSIICQSFNDFEWIVVDGGSTDGSRELIEQYSDRISWWCAEKDNGVYNAMNKGILRAQGEYCFFLNSGDYLVNSCVLQDVFNLNIDEDIVLGYLKWGGRPFTTIKDHDVTLRTFVESGLVHSGGAFIKRDLFGKSFYGLYDENLKIFSDYKWYLQSLILGDATLRHIDICVSVFEAGGMSETQIKVDYNERQTVLKELIPERILKDYIKPFDVSTIRSTKRMSSVSFSMLTKAIIYKCLKPLLHKA